ncbi:MAG: hypothetical protein AB1546_04790, partial [bacterium]
MNIADIVVIISIAVFTGLGIMFGSVRSAGALIGVVLASRIAENYLSKGQTSYIFIFLGVVAGCTVIGFLAYGATRFHPIEVMEGAFGAAMGFAVGWGIARFIFHVAFMFHPDSSLAQAVYASALGMSVYDIAPIRKILEIGDPLMHPKIFKT